MSSRLLTIAPVPSTANLHHLRIHLLPHPPSSRVSRLTTVSAPFLPVPPLRHLPCLPLCCSRASSRAEFIPPAKYPRVCLLISPSSSRIRFSLPPITILSARLSAFFLSLYHSFQFQFGLFRSSCPSDIFGLALLRVPSSPRLIISLLLPPFFFYILAYILSKLPTFYA